MSQPLNKAPEFATDPVFLGGPDSGQPVRVAASLSEQRQGVAAGYEEPAARFNWNLGVMGDHVRNVAENHLRGWVSVNVTSGVFAIDDVIQGIFAYVRGAEKVPRVVVFGSDAAETTQRSKWFRAPRAWHTNSYSVSDAGSARSMAATLDGSVSVSVGLSMGNKAEYTNDGIAWNQVNTHGAFNYRSVCWHDADAAFYAIPESGTTVGKSSDGVTWAATSSDPGVSSKSLVRSGKSSGTACVLLASGNRSWISTDGGASWLSGPAGSFSLGTLVDIQYSAGAALWLAITNRLGVLVSADGLNWTQVRAESLPVGSGNAITNLATDGGGAWVVGGNSTAGEAPGAFVAYSTDNGISWRFEALDNEEAQQVHVCYSPGEARFYAVAHVIDGSREPTAYRSHVCGADGGLASL